MSIKISDMLQSAANDPDRMQIAHRAASMGLASDGHLADVFGMDMVQAATSPTGYTAAQAYYALDQATEPGDFMGARNVGSMSQEEAMEVFGAYVEGYREGVAIADTDTFAGMFSKGRIRRYKKQMERYTAARSANNQKKAARALGRMKALWGRMSEADRQGLTSPDKLAVPGVEVAKAVSPKAAKIDQKISQDDEASTDAAEAEMAAEQAMGAAFGAAGAKGFKNRRAYIEAIIKGRAAGNLALSAIEPLFAAVKWKKGLPTPAEVMDGAEVSLDMVIPAKKKSGSSNDLYGADAEIDAEMNAEDVMGEVFGADGVKEYKNRKAYVEAAMKAIAEGKLGKVNLVALWKKVKGRKGLPSPAQIKAGAEVTADMAIPQPSSAVGAEELGYLPGFAVSPEASSDYLNRKAYVEAAVNAVATGRLGKVNLVKLWKLVKGRKGLPSPNEIKAGASITLDMVKPPSAMGYAFGDDDLPEDDSDIDAVLGADDDEDMDELGYIPGLAVSPEASSDYLNRKAYVEAAVNAVATGRLGKVNLVRLWKLVKGRKGLPSPNEIKAGASITLDMVKPPSAMGYAFGDDDLPEDDSDIDAVLGADDDEDMDELGYIPGLAVSPEASSDYLNRKAYVEAAVNAVATGRLGKVNLVRLWKLVKGRKGLPSPNEIKAGAPITIDMIKPPSASYMFGDDGLPEDDSDIDAVLGADDDEDMDELGAMSGMMLTPTVSSSSAVGHDYPNRKAYVEAAVNAVSSGRLGRVNLVRLWKLVKVRRGLPSPAEIKAGAPITLDMALPQFSVTSSFGDSGSPEDGLNNDVLGIDDDFDADDGEEDFGLLPTIVAVTAARRVGFGNPTAYAKYRKQFNSKISRGFPIRGARLDWKQINRSWDQMSKDERKGLASPKEILADIAMKSSKTLEAASEATGFGVPEIKELISKRKAEVMGYSFGDDLPEDDSDIDAVLGADDDEDMDDLGADDDDDMDDLGADEDFGLDDIEMDLDLEMQRALVNRYSGADQPFPAGGAAPFPGPRMAGHEVF